MPSITTPAATRAIPVGPSQALRLGADGNADWYVRTVVTGSESWGAPVASDVATLVYETSASVTRRWTFDRVQVQVTAPGAGAPSLDPDLGLRLNLCEGPVALLWVSPALRNEAMEEPALRPWEGEDDDPPLGTTLLMPGANRDRMGTVLCETVSEPGGPANLIASYSPGVFVDTAGRLGVRTPFTNDVRGLGPFPAVAAWYHSNLYFEHDMGKRRALGLTRVLYQDPTTGDVAVVRGDGRRNSYRSDGGAFEAAVGLENTLTAAGGVFEETTPSGRVYRYDSAGRLQRVIDLRGSTAYYAYDANDRLQKIQAAGGSNGLGLVPYLSYDGSGLLTRLVLEDPAAAANNRSSYFQYDGDRNLIRIIGPESCVTYFEYNDPLRLSAVTDSEGYRWYFAFDANGRVSRVIDAVGNAAYFAFDTGVPLATHEDRAGKATYFQFSAFGAPETVWNPGTPADYYAWDGEGNLVSSQNRVGDAWTYEYDPRANRIAVNDPLGARSYFAYDGQDLLRSYTDPIGRTTALDFDGARNRTRSIDPLGNTVYFEYEPSGLLRQRKDRRGAFTYFVWDERANLQAVNDALGQATYFAYNSANERTAQVDPLGRISYLEHDLRGRVIKAVDPIGAANYFAFDGRCNLVLQKDALLRQTDHLYDGNSNRTLTLLPAVDGVRNPTYWAYDPEERLASQRNARLYAFNWDYDALGRRQTQTDPLGGETTFAYTAAHQLALQLDALENPSYLAYDAAGRVSHRKDALQQETYFGFDLAGQPVLVEAPLGRVSYFQHDPRGWQRQTKSAIGAISYMAFDAEGNRLRSVDPLGKTTYFIYDLLGRATHTEDQLGGVTYTGYDRASQSVLRLDELGFPTYMAYDQAGRSQRTLDPAGLVSYMTYDLVGNLIAQSLQQGWGHAPWGCSPYGGERATTTFAHDALNRTVSRTDAYGNVSLTVYDRNGNAVTQVDELGFGTYFTFDALDRRTHTQDGVHFATTYMGYDAVGNVVASVDQQGVTAYMTYDRLNRVSFQHEGGSGLLTYHVFDAVGNRTEQHLLLGAGGERRSTYFEFDLVNRTTRQIAADGGATVFEFDLAGNQTRVVDPVGRPSYMAYDDLNRTAARWNALLETSYLHYDARSKAVRLVDPEGRTAYMGYDAARRLLHQSNALGEFSYFCYDARGQRTQVTNPRGYSTRFRFDLLGRQTHRIDALGGIAYMGYDAVGNQVLSEGPEESNFLGLYYVPLAATSIKRVEPDGTGDETVLTGESGLGPIALDLNAPGGKLYWAGFEFVKRANLDGSDEETIIGSSDLGTPGGITVDVNGGRIYFADEDTEEVKSANLDGSDVQTLSNPGSVRGLAVDPVGGKLYYTNTDTQQLRRMNLDGSGDELLVGSLLEPWGVALDLLSKQVYWVDRDTNNHIRRANLDGSSPATVLSGLGGPFEVAVDPIRGRLYWTEGDTSVLKSANLDGSGSASVISGTVGGIALSVPLRVSLSSFDGLRRATHVRDALMHVTYMGYDSRSSLVVRIDADGRSTYMGYDQAGRMSRQQHKTPVVDETETSPSYYAYNQVNELTIVDDHLAGLGASYFQCDAMGRLIKKFTLSGAVYYEWDQSGRKLRLKDPDLRESFYVHDPAGRLDRIVLDSSRTAYYYHDRSGLLTLKIQPGDAALHYYTYDGAGRLNLLTGRSATSQVVYFSYQRNPNGVARWVRREDGLNIYFEHDDLDRLTREDWKGADSTVYGFTWSYDSWGSRATKTNLAVGECTYFRYDTRGMVAVERTPQTGATISYGHDASCRTMLRWGPQMAMYFAYDQRDRVTALGFEAPVPPNPQYFAYNGVAERVRIRVGASETYLAWDSDKLLLERSSGVVLRRYRNNQGPNDDLGFLIVKEDLEFGDLTPFTDENGSVVVEGGLKQHLSSKGEILAGSLPNGERVVLVPITGLIQLLKSPSAYSGPDGSVLIPESGFRTPGGSMLRAPADDPQDAPLAEDPGDEGCCEDSWCGTFIDQIGEDVASLPGATVGGIVRQAGGAKSVLTGEAVTKALLGHGRAWLAGSEGTCEAAWGYVSDSAGGACRDVLCATGIDSFFLGGYSLIDRLLHEDPQRPLPPRATADLAVTVVTIFLTRKCCNVVGEALVRARPSPPIALTALRRLQPLKGKIVQAPLVDPLPLYPKAKVRRILNALQGRHPETGRPGRNPPGGPVGVIVDSELAEFFFKLLGVEHPKMVEAAYIPRAGGPGTLCFRGMDIPRATFVEELYHLGDHHNRGYPATLPYWPSELAASEHLLYLARGGSMALQRGSACKLWSAAEILEIERDLLRKRAAAGNTPAPPGPR